MWECAAMENIISQNWRRPTLIVHQSNIVQSLEPVLINPLQWVLQVAMDPHTTITRCRTIFVLFFWSIFAIHHSWCFLERSSACRWLLLIPLLFSFSVLFPTLIHSFVTFFSFQWHFFFWKHKQRFMPTCCILLFIHFTIQTHWISLNSIQNNVAKLQIRKQKSKGKSKPQGFISPQIHTLYPNWMFFFNHQDCQILPATNVSYKKVVICTSITQIKEHVWCEIQIVTWEKIWGITRSRRAKNIKTMAIKALLTSTN